MICPQCHRVYAETGFCPQDGARLVEEDSFDGESLHGDTSDSAVSKVLEEVRRKNLEDMKLEGTVLDDRYRLEKRIGSGGMGMVFLATHTVIEKTVAVKVLRPEVAADDDVVKRFVREAKAASRIGHPNIIDVTDFGSTQDGLTYQVMEYLEGELLSDVIRAQGRLPIERALPIVTQIARALSFAHDKGIVHRDLKPENIFLLKRDGRDDFVKIVDFGIAKVQPGNTLAQQPRLTRVGSIFGTPEYMAPEQAAGRDNVDSRADIYALAIILFEMLTGEVPLRGESSVRTLAMQMLDAPPAVSERAPELSMGHEFDQVVMKAMAKKPDERYQTMMSFLEALERITSSAMLDMQNVLRQERKSGALHVPSQAAALSLRSRAASKGMPSPRSANPTAVPEAPSAGRALSRTTGPAFLGYDAGASFAAGGGPRTRKSKGPWIAALALVLAGGGALAYVQMNKDADNRAAVSIDAGFVFDAAGAPDASALVDAGAIDGDVVDAAPPSPRPIPRDDIRPPVDITGKQAAETEVTIYTRPRGASLFIGDSYAGTDGLNLQRKTGATVKVSCKLEDHEDGSVEIEFSGRQEIFLCRLKPKRKARCVEGIANPFDDCVEES